MYVKEANTEQRALLDSIETIARFAATAPARFATEHIKLDCLEAIPPHAFEKALKLSETAHAALGCRGVTRADLRYDDINDVLVLLEVNTQPGMTPTSLVPEQAAAQGVDFDRLVLWIVEDAYARGAGGIASSGETSGENAR